MQSARVHRQAKSEPWWLKGQKVTHRPGQVTSSQSHLPARKCQENGRNEHSLTQLLMQTLYSYV